MIITPNYTSANHPQACFQQAVFQCNLMIKACCDAPHFGENHNSADWKHSPNGELYFSVVGKHSQDGEWYFSVVRRHSPSGKRYFSADERHSTGGEPYFPSGDRHSLNLDGNVIKNADYF